MIFGRSLAMLATAFLMACTPGPQEAQSDTVRIGIGSDLRSLEPGVNRDTFTDDMMAHAVEALVAYREDLSVAPMLARSIEVSDDGLVYQFGLREDVLFHNGEPLTAKDVQWNIERLIAPDSEFLCKNWYDGSEGLEILNVNALDPQTVEIRINRPDGLFLARLANFQCLTGIVHPDSVDADGNWSFPIGTGPYRFTQWNKGRFVEMERFAQYSAREEPRSGFAGSREATIPKLRWVVVPDQASARAGLLAGQLDIISGIDVNDLAELRLQKAIDVHVAQSLDWNALLLQTDDPLIGDPNFRRAVFHAIDTGALADAVTLGISDANPSPISSASSFHKAKQDTRIKFDPQAASKYLKASNYAGETIFLTTNRRFQNMFDNAIYIQAMLRDVGIAAELDVTEWSTQLSRYYAGDFQLMSFGYSARTDPVLAFETFVGDKSADGWAQWSSPQARALIDQAIAEDDVALRQQYFDQVHDLMLTDLPIMPMFNHYVIHASSDRLAGYEPWTANRVRLWGVNIRDGRS